MGFHNIIDALSEPTREHVQRAHQEREKIHYDIEA